MEEGHESIGVYTVYYTIEIVWINNSPHWGVAGMCQVRCIGCVYCVLDGGQAR